MESSEFPQEERRPTPPNKKTQKKKRTMGLVAFCAVIAAIVFLILVATITFLAYRGKAVTGTHLDLITVSVILGAALAGISLIISIITLFVRNQKKGFAITSLLLALLVLLGCVGAMYLYDYVFSDMEYDLRFKQYSKDDLNVVEINNSGEVIRETEEEKPLVTPEHIQELSLSDEIEFEEVLSDEIPEEAQEKMYGAEPTGPSYLMGDYDQIQNFMLIGIDDIGSSDSMILFSVDKVHHKLKMISIARDSYLMIPEFGIRCKAAYSYNWGGAKMTVGMINRNFALNVEDYITVGLDQLAAIIDSIDGIDVELTDQDVSFLRSRYSYLDLHSGKCHLDGAAAATYSRNRSDSEANRTGRQRAVISAIMLKVRKMPLSEYPEFIKNCLGLCTTSFSSDELMKLSVEVVQHDYSVESYALVENVDYWGGILGEERYFYVVYDTRRASDWIYRTIYEDLYKSGYPD